MSREPVVLRNGWCVLMSPSQMQRWLLYFFIKASARLLKSQERYHHVDDIVPDGAIGPSTGWHMQFSLLQQKPEAGCEVQAEPELP